MAIRCPQKRRFNGKGPSSIYYQYRSPYKWRPLWQDKGKKPISP